MVLAGGFELLLLLSDALLNLLADGSDLGLDADGLGLFGLQGRFGLIQGLLKDGLLEVRLVFRRSKPANILI